MACNMACRYCYLEEETRDLKTAHGPLETLRYAVDKMRSEDIIPFNISLHGGEVTCLSTAEFSGLTAYIKEYYEKNRGLLTGAGFKVGSPHIKTNLLALDRHIDAIREHGVSISGSIDLPLSLHREYRLRKSAVYGQNSAASGPNDAAPGQKSAASGSNDAAPGRKSAVPGPGTDLGNGAGDDGNVPSSTDAFPETPENVPSSADTLPKILENVALLKDLPNHKKVSATIFREHLERIDELIGDIWYLHRNTCLDMLDFNFMIGFENSSGLLHALTEEEQLQFFRKIRDAFLGTELEAGLKGAWFREFGPDYCTNCINCGEKFYLLEKNGDVYSCVRGQKQPDFYYGNIYEESMRAIMERAAARIRSVHEACGFDDECGTCEYLYLCRTGCPFVKRNQHRARSYTCRLQKELYALWGIPGEDYSRPTALDYVCRMHPDRISDYALAKLPAQIPDLGTLIREDPGLRYIYEPGIYILSIDGIDYPLEPQIRKRDRVFAFITPESRVRLYAKRGIFEIGSRYPANNALYIQLLTGDMIVYGDEARSKQRHIANEMIYKQVAETEESDRDGYILTDITHFLKRYGTYLSREEANNIFITTTALRDYHYTKQKNNAFYHIQAIDLPFHNLEFYYLTLEETK